MQVILVGDKDQLPSVGPGQVLHDLLGIDQIPKVELNQIYRQGDGSSIIPLLMKSKKVIYQVIFCKIKRSFFLSKRCLQYRTFNRKDC